MVICLERGADLHVFQLMPLPLTVSCFSKFQIGFAFLVPAHPGSPGKGPLNGCVCVCVCWYSCGEIRTWHEVLVGDADGAQCVVRHRLNEVGDHRALVVGCKRTRLAVVSDNPRTSEDTVRVTIRDAILTCARKPT